MSSEKSVTPQIRFKGFTEAWEQRELGDIAEIIGGGTPDTNNPSYWDGDIDWYSPAELGEQIYAIGSRRRITKEGYKNSSAKLLPANKTILFTSRAGIGTTAILCRSACTNQGFQSLVINDNTDLYFIYSMSSRIKDFAISKASGSTFLEISGKQLATMNLFLPQLNEQRKIGQYFKSLDNLITLHQRKLDILKKIKSALLEKMFPKDGSDIPEIRFTGFTEAWEQRKLGELFEYLSSQVQASQAQAEGRYKLFDASSQIGYSSTGSNRPLITIIKDGSGVGRIRLIPYNSWFIGTLGGLLANETDVDFGYALLQNIDFSIYIIGSTIPHIYFKDYSTAPLLIAKIKEQQMIGKVFSKIDSLITLHQRKLNALKKIKSALLEKMFV